MLTLKIIGADGSEKGVWKETDISADYTGGLSSGDQIKVLLDGCDHLAVQLDPSMEEAFLWVPGRSFVFTVPPKEVLERGYKPGAFSTEHQIIRVREPEDEEFYGYRNLAQNSHDAPGTLKIYPHASANFVTREDPCFYARNAIDGVINNLGHGVYPFHSWAGGAREDLEFWLDFGRDVEIDKIVFYLRADFTPVPPQNEPHDSYWKNIDIEFSDGEIIHGEFTMNRSGGLLPENAQGIEVTFDKKSHKIYTFISF